MGKPVARFTVTIPAAVADKIREIAEKEERSQSQVVAILLRKAVLGDGDKGGPRSR